MIKITKKLIREIIKIDNITLQDYEILKNFIQLGLHNQDNSNLFYQALKKYNQSTKRCYND